MVSKLSAPAFKLKQILSCLYPMIIIFFLAGPSVVGAAQDGPYVAVPALIDLRTNFSDGSHTIEELVALARSRGFKVLFINDHDRIALSYGVPPFRRILRYKKEYSSIMTHGPDKFLEEINRVSKIYPDMIIIPGCTTSAFYYWTGSWLKKDLTVHEYDRKILILNFTRAEDYKLIPNVENKWSMKNAEELLPGVVVFLIPLFIGFILLRGKGFYRLLGFFLVIVSILAVVDYNPFRSSLYSPYAGDQGIKPFQEMIDFVNQRGGYAFWNYPEQRSGIRRHGPINVDTPPYPQVLHQSRRYTGFSAIYGDNITITEPGKEWDKVLNEYCRGERKRPPWGISTATFHQDGRLGLKLGAFPTTLLIKKFSREGILEALKKGRMYSSRGDGRVWPRLDYFNIYGEINEMAYMGETLATSHFPVIKFKVSYQSPKPKPTTLHLIRGGTLIKTFSSDTPVEVEYMDHQIPPGETTYYRLMDARKLLTSNPIFVRYNPNPDSGK